MRRERDRLSISVSDQQTSDGESKLNLQALESSGNLPINRGARRLRTFLAILFAGTFIFCRAAPVSAQGQKSKIPIVGKLTSGNRQQVYSGKVQSLDMKQRILNVDSHHGQETEIFPFRKNVHIESVTGNKMSLSELTPGTSVLIYFDQKSGDRKIKNIVILSSDKKQAKGKPKPSS